VETAVPVEPVHLVEQGGHRLDLVDYDLPAPPRRLGVQLRAAGLRACEVAAKDICLEQVDPASLSVRLTQEGALARLEWSPEEDGLGSGAGRGRALLNTYLDLS